MSLPVPIIYETGTLDHAPPQLMDVLWAEGWRHFGRDFFRYSVAPDADGGIHTIQPLRIPVAAFRPDKSQRRVQRRNADAEVRIVPAVVDACREDLFMRHRTRFKDNIPDSLRNFISSERPHVDPCECVSVEVRLGSRLIAVSYLDVGHRAVSSVYAMFDPEESRRGLGTFTLLEEIRWASETGRKWLYPGYATHGPSAYDYKKTFRPLECFDWNGNWKPLGRESHSV